MINSTKTYTVCSTASSTKSSGTKCQSSSNVSIQYMILTVHHSKLTEKQSFLFLSLKFSCQSFATIYSTIPMDLRDLDYDPNLDVSINIPQTTHYGK
jgi:hypothetical protein